MNSPKDSTPNPLSLSQLLAGIVVTVIGGLILALILQYINLPSNEVPSVSNVTNTLSLTNTPLSPSPTPLLVNALVPPANTSTVFVSSSTPVVPVICQVEGAFGSVWREHTTQLGCNQGSVQTGPITIEAFQNGYLVWIKAEDRIYVIKHNGQWSVHANSWITGEDDLPCDAARSYGYPAMGFGKLWCNDSAINSSLGAPLDREQPDDNAQRQIFENGQIFRAYRGKTFVLVNNGQCWIV